jgi:hypothetical protein
MYNDVTVSVKPVKDSSQVEYFDVSYEGLKSKLTVTDLKPV